MFQKIVKRDNRIVKFDKRKIESAILKAGEASGEFSQDEAKRLADIVLRKAKIILRDKTPTVEEIQDIVEIVLLNSVYKQTAKLYILYREQHHYIREIRETGDLTLIDSYIKQNDWKVKENSNMSYSLQGLNNYIASKISKVYWLRKLYPKNVRKAHINGNIHIHDLNMLSVYCVGWDLQDLLRVGFTGVSGKIESKPAKHLRSALGQVVNFFYTLQGEAAGAQAFSNFDTLLAPFIRYDNLNFSDVKQSVQEFFFNVNIPTRVGFQTPFTNITLDIHPSKILANRHVIIGGETQNETYSEFQEEMNMLNRALFEVWNEGDAKGRPFTFPIPTINIDKSFAWDDPNLEPLWKITSKYGIPYFANFVNSDMKTEDSFSMCCRLRIDTKALRNRGGGLFGANPLTGSIGVFTINMPRIGYLSKTENEFISRLENIMNICKDGLETKRKVLEKFTRQGLYPYSKYYLRFAKQRFGEYWHNHFLTIGLVGLNEACLNFMHKDIGTSEGNKFASRVLTFMRNKLLEYQEETGHFYNLEATPAESTAYSLAKIDKKKYCDMIFANGINPEEPYYTNSSQLPVNYSNDVFEQLDLQNDLQTKYTGGTVFHVFLGESLISSESIKNFVKKICNSYSIPYFTITPTFSICPKHGYLIGEQKVCPICNSKTEIYSRVVGYLRPVDQWNNGKKMEYDDRLNFEIGGSNNER